MKILFIEGVVEHGMSVTRYGIEREDGDDAEFEKFITENKLEYEGTHVYAYKTPFKKKET